MTARRKLKADERHHFRLRPATVDGELVPARCHFPLGGKLVMFPAKGRTLTVEGRTGAWLKRRWLDGTLEIVEPAKPVKAAKTKKTLTKETSDA